MSRYLFFIFYALLLLGIGIYGMKRTKTFSDFFLGSRAIGPWLSAFTYGTAYFSAVIFVGFAGKIGWGFGYSALWVAIGNALIGTLFVWAVMGKRIRKASIEMNAYTMPEFLQVRYKSNFLKIFTAITIFVFLVPYAASVFMGLSYLFEINFNIKFEYILILMAVLISLYMILGGFKSVVLVDVIQGTIMIFGVILLVYFSIKNGGGLSSITNKLSSIDPKLSQVIGPPGFFPLLFIVIITSVAPLAMPQLVQKFYSIKDDRSIKSGTIICTIFAIVVAGSAYFFGSLTRVFLSPQTHPEIFADKIHFVDKLVPTLIKTTIPQGLNFVILLLVLSASMSTLAALVLVSSSSIVKDLYHGFVKPKASDKKLNLLMRIMCAVFILTSVFITLLRPAVILTLLVISWGAIAAVFLSPFIYGLFWKKANKIAAEISSVLGLAITLTLFFILPRNQIPFIATLGMGIPMITFPLIVWITRKKDNNYKCKEVL